MGWFSKKQDSNKILVPAAEPLKIVKPNYELVKESSVPVRLKIVVLLIDTHFGRRYAYIREKLGSYTNRAELIRGSMAGSLHEAIKQDREERAGRAGYASKYEIILSEPYTNTELNFDAVEKANEKIENVESYQINVFEDKNGRRFGIHMDEIREIKISRVIESKEESFIVTYNVKPLENTNE